MFFSSEMSPFCLIILLWLHVDVEDWVDRAFGQSAVVLTHLHVDVPVLHSSMESGLICGSYQRT